MGMAERLEWEAIERRKHQIARVTRGGLASTAEERELEYIDALEAGEAMARELVKGCEYCAGRWPKLFEIARAVDTSEGREWRHYARQPSTGYAPCALLPSQHAALADWRRCVAPRGEDEVSQ